MSNSDLNIDDFRNMRIQPRYPKCNVVLSIEEASKLGEAIACAAISVTDSEGRKMPVMGDMTLLVNLAANVVGEWLHTGVWIDRRDEG